MELSSISKQNKYIPNYHRLVLLILLPSAGHTYLLNQGALRVWIPGADKVELIVGKEPRIELAREGESGFILARKRLRFTHYKLAVDWAGKEQIIDDPYQYHELYASYEDLHTPKDMYHHMGAQFVTLERDGQVISGTRF